MRVRSPDKRQQLTNSYDCNEITNKIKLNFNTQTLHMHTCAQLMSLKYGRSNNKGSCIRFEVTLRIDDYFIMCLMATKWATK